MYYIKFIVPDKIFQVNFFQPVNKNTRANRITALPTARGKQDTVLPAIHTRYKQESFGFITAFCTSFQVVMKHQPI